MDFLVKRDDLLKVLQSCFGIVERKQTMPVLANVLLEIKENQLTVIATDTEIEAIFTITPEKINSIDKINKTTVSAKKLLEICRNMPAGSTLHFCFNSEKMKMKVVAGGSRFVLSCLADDQFPNLKLDIQGGSCNLPQEALLTALKKVHFSMGYQDVRYFLNGLLLEFVNQELAFVATDGHRLAITKLLLEKTPEYTENKAFDDNSHIKIILPRKAVVELMRLLDQVPDNIKVLFSKNHIQFSLQHIVFTAKLLEGQYPDYKRVIPNKGPYELSARKETFKQALNSVSILANEQYNGVLFELKESNPEMVLQTYNPEQEVAHAKIPVDYTGKDVKIGFNIRYLNEILGVLSEDCFKLTLENEQGSALIQQDADASTQYVVMPIRI